MSNFIDPDIIKNSFDITAADFTEEIQLKSKHDEKLSPIFMSLSCSYVCMHIQEKITIHKKLSPWRYWQLKTLLPAVGGDQSGDADRGTAALAYCKSRVWAARDVLQLAKQSFE